MCIPQDSGEMSYLSLQGVGGLKFVFVLGDQQDILKHFDKLYFKHEGMKINIALDLPACSN